MTTPTGSKHEVTFKHGIAIQGYSIDGAAVESQFQDFLRPHTDVVPFIVVTKVAPAEAALAAAPKRARMEK